jgi:hypothetical protein
MIDKLQLLQTLNAHICHDLAGSISIIDNCLNLMDTKNSAIRKKAELLAHEESGNLVRKIKFFRECYGAAEIGKQVSLGHVSKLLSYYFVNNALQPKLHLEEKLENSNSVLAKASVCLAVIASKHANTDGKLDIFISNNESRILLASKNIKKKEDSFFILTGKEDVPLNVRNCSEHYVYALCKQAGYKILVSKTADILEYRLVR